MKSQKKQKKKTSLPRSFRPILWDLDWRKVDPHKDKEDIIVNTVNEGTINQWRWIREHYGDPAIRNILRHRVVTEFHPESLKLAKIVFGHRATPHARRSTHPNRH